jgi:DNA mismatch repair protein MutS
MNFESILFPHACAREAEEAVTPPEFFVDLNLDQIIASITAGKQEYRLEVFFYEPLRGLEAVAYRQQIMLDIEDGRVFGALQIFAEKMRRMRQDSVLAGKLYSKLQQQRWFLEAVYTYCDAVTALLQELSAAELRARGLLAFRQYLDAYVASERFVALREQTTKLIAKLSAIRYNVFIEGLRVEVSDYGGESDYSAEVEETFERFKQGAAKEYTFKFPNSVDMDNVEVQILALVAQLHPEVFAAAESFHAENQNFQDDTIRRFDREIQFYIAYLEHISRMQKAGLRFCYPHVVQHSKEIYNYEGFDLALAGKLIQEKAPVVCNDFHLRGPERMIVVSGPNQGGKTTFARMFGQLHYLASLGCPVPGARAQLFLFNQLFTHFEREESVNNLRGKLEDDLLRLHGILERATPNSMVILNEIFTSTTLRDAVLLSKKIASQLIELDALCVWVTFLDELAMLGEQTVSMMSTVVPDNPAQRTYKVVRRPADGLAYAMAIAEKYRLTYPMIKERIGL